MLCDNEKKTWCCMVCCRSKVKSIQTSLNACKIMITEVIALIFLTAHASIHDLSLCQFFRMIGAREGTAMYDIVGSHMLEPTSNEKLLFITP